MNDSVIWQVLYAILEAIESANKAQRETHYSREIEDLIEGAKCIMLRMTVQSRDAHLQEND